MKKKVPDLSFLHPLFRNSLSKILWYGPVEKINTHNVKQKRELAISNFGLFLLKQTKFPKSLVITKYLSLGDIKYMLLDPEMVIICDKPKSPKFTLVSPKIVKITSIIYSICNALYGKKMKLNFQCTTEVKPKFESSKFFYESQNPLSERFLSNLLGSKLTIKQLNVDMIQDTIDLLVKTRNSFTITSDLVASIFIDSITKSIALDQDISDLTLSDLNFSSFIPYFLPILKENDSITTLKLTNIRFSESSKKLKIQNNKWKFSFQNIILENCKISTPYFTIFLEILNHFHDKINCLTVLKCSFNDETLKLLFNTINCLSDLDTLKIECINSNKSLLVTLISEQLAKSTQENHIKRLSIDNNGINLANLLPCVKSISRLNVSGNKFNSTIQNIELNFESADEIYFSRCVFSDAKFNLLISTLSQESSKPTILHFDAIICNNNNKLYEDLSKAKIPSLQALTWNDNAMNDLQTGFFARFLKANPNLVEIELNGSTFDCDVFRNNELFDSRFTKIALHAIPNQKIIFGKSLIDLLNPTKLVNLRVLDITNQKMGDDSIYFLQKLIFENEECLIEELYFDGQEIETSDLLFSFLENLCGVVTLHKASWPDSDISFLISHTTIAKRVDVKGGYERLRKRFIKAINNKFALSRQNSRARFAPQACSRAKSPLNQSSNLGLPPRTNSRTLSIPTPNYSQANATNSYNKLLNEITFRENEILELMKECVGENVDDVLVNKFKIINGL